MPASGPTGCAGWSTWRASADPRARRRRRPTATASGCDQLKKHQRGELALRAYDDIDGVARRLAKTNPRLARDQAGRDKADWLARHWSRRNADGQWEILGDPAHKIVNAQLLRVDELLEVYKRITMPLLAVEAADDSMWQWWKGSFTVEQYHERLKAIARLSASPWCRTPATCCTMTSPSSWRACWKTSCRPDQASNHSRGTAPRVDGPGWARHAMRKCPVDYPPPNQDKHHGRSTHQPDRHPIERPERAHPRVTGVSLTTMPNPNA